MIFDERLAKRFWPGQLPLGKRMCQPQPAEDPLATDENTRWLTVVGSIRLRGLLDGDERVGAYYFPYE